MTRSTRHARHRATVLRLVAAAALLASAVACKADSSGAPTDEALSLPSTMVGHYEGALGTAGLYFDLLDQGTVVCTPCRVSGTAGALAARPNDVAVVTGGSVNEINGQYQISFQTSNGQTLSGTLRIENGLAVASGASNTGTAWRATRYAVGVASVVITPPSVTLAPGETRQLTAATKDASGSVLAGRVVTWSSSAPGVANVTGNGLVTAAASGSATITALSEGVRGVATVSVAPGSHGRLADAARPER